MPQRILGRDLFRYLEATGLMAKNVETRIGQRLQYRETLIGSHPRTARRRHGIKLHGRTVEASGHEVTFDGGERLAPHSVIWATGFRLDHSWIELPVFDEHNKVVHKRGVTAAPGLYFLGLPWQYTRGSALLGWVRDDAQHIAEQIVTFQRTRPAAVPA